MRTADEGVRPAIWGPVLIAAVFLAVIGGSAGWLLGNRAEDAERLAAERDAGLQQQVQQQDPRVEQTPGRQEPGAGTSTTQPSDRHTEPAQVTPTDRCPDRTVQRAGKAGAYGKVTLVAYHRYVYSEVWICADANHTLFYQGHRGPSGERWIEGTNVLFLTDVVDKGDHYLATNSVSGKSTSYRVYDHELLIENAGGTTREAAAG